MTKKQVPFTTEDGVRIVSEKQDVWYVSNDFSAHGRENLLRNETYEPSKRYKYFSTEKAMNNYLKTKSC